MPKHIQVSPACLDFLNSCLRFDSAKRKNWDELLSHHFLIGIRVNMMQEEKIETADIKNSLCIDTRKSVNFYQQYTG